MTGEYLLDKEWARAISVFATLIDTPRFQSMAIGGKAVGVCKLTTLFHLKLKDGNVWSLINSAMGKFSFSFINSRTLKNLSFGQWSHPEPEQRSLVWVFAKKTLLILVWSSSFVKRCKTRSLH